MVRSQHHHFWVMLAWTSPSSSSQPCSRRPALDPKAPAELSPSVGNQHWNPKAPVQGILARELG